MSGFFRYPGGKAKLLDVIGEQMAKFGDGLEYREPFFGGGAVGLRFIRERRPRVAWLNDKDAGIACLWTAVADHHEELKARVLRFKPTVQDFYQLRHELRRLAAMPQDVNGIVGIGFKKLALHQLSYSGLGARSGGPLGGAAQKYLITSRWSPRYICQRIDEFHNLLRSVELRGGRCTNLDFAALIADESCASLLYLDPPYYVGGNALYHHGFTLADHERLAAALRNTRHKWLLSYDDCEQVRRLYRWADIRQVQVKYSVREPRAKPELLIAARHSSMSPPLARHQEIWGWHEDDLSLPSQADPRKWCEEDSQEGFPSDVLTRTAADCLADAVKRLPEMDEAEKPTTIKAARKVMQWGDKLREALGD